MKVYSKFQEMVDDSANYGLPMSILFAEAFNQLFGRVTLLEKDHDQVIKENKKLKEILKSFGKMRVEKDGSIIMPKNLHEFFYDGQEEKA